MSKQRGEQKVSNVSLSQQKVRVDFIFHLNDSTSLYSIEMEKGAVLKDAVHTLPLRMKFRNGEIGSWVEEIEGMGEFSRDGRKTGFGWQFYINRNGETGLPYTVNDTAYFPGIDDFKVNSNLKMEWKYECQECDIDCNRLAARTKRTEEEIHLFTGKEPEDAPKNTNPGWKDYSTREPYAIILNKLKNPEQKERPRIHIPVRSYQAVEYAIAISASERPVRAEPFIYAPATSRIDSIQVNGFAPQVRKENSVQAARISNVRAKIATKRQSTVPMAIAIKQKLNSVVSMPQKILRSIQMKAAEMINRFKAKFVKLSRTIKNTIQKATNFMFHTVNSIKRTVDRIVAPVIQQIQNTVKFVQRIKSKAVKVLSYVRRAPVTVISLITASITKGWKRATSSLMKIKQSIRSIKPQPAMMNILVGIVVLAVLAVITIKFS